MATCIQPRWTTSKACVHRPPEPLKRRCAEEARKVAQGGLAARSHGLPAVPMDGIAGRSEHYVDRAVMLQIAQGVARWFESGDCRHRGGSLLALGRRC